jgi:LysM repeat protein
LPAISFFTLHSSFCLLHFCEVLVTKETKIGLLVGLAFVIVIGILISDQITRSTEPPQAALGGAGNGVRQAVGTPGTSGATSPVTVVTPVVTPQQTVATQAEVTNPPPAVPIVKIGGPETPQQSPQQSAALATDDSKNSPAENKPADTSAVASNDTPVITPVPTAPTATDTELSKVAEAHGEQLVAADDTKDAAGSAQTYVAQPGDSLSRIAAKFLGSGIKSNRDLIVKANPSLQGNENMIIAGKTYQIPAAGKTATSKTQAPVATAAQTPTAVDDTTAKTASATEDKPSKAAKDASYFYTVQPGDNLTKIARDEVGDVRAIAAIQELNADKLKGENHDIVIAGSKIRLPGKPLARAE